MASPNFFIIGAPKCGTTSLSEWLKSHPSIFIPEVKEPHFFSSDLNNRRIAGRNSYFSLYKNISPEKKCIGDASTWYLFSNDAIDNIEESLPGSKYIVMTRNVIDMAHSLYHHNVRCLYESAPSFEEAWYLQDMRNADSSLIPKACTEPAFLQYKKACSLGSMLRNLYSKVPRERVLHLPISDIKSDPLASYIRVLDFLGLEYDGRKDFSAKNEARTYRYKYLHIIIRIGGRLRRMLGINKGFGISKLNERAIRKDALSEDFMSTLKNEFFEEIKILESLSVENS